ncbi:winged helix-turn-helix domain-containing protein [Streptomyces sp. NPDC052114]|uniref:ArsR/SmtB family transcription factor n=1 Tax=unclassified Streptomyces TaxID=2593676 RepID=UPI003426F33D
MTSEDLLAVLAAMGHRQRLRAVAELADGRLHMGELARRLGMSRPLLHLHLNRLEKAGLVACHLERSREGKALRYVELAPFALNLTVDTVLGALAQDTEGHVNMKGTAT